MQIRLTFYVYVLSRWYVFSIFNLLHLQYDKVLGQGLALKAGLSTDFKKVVDKTLTPIPSTTPNDYPKMDYATEVK